MNVLTQLILLLGTREKSFERNQRLHVRNGTAVYASHEGHHHVLIEIQSLLAFQDLTLHFGGFVVVLLCLRHETVQCYGETVQAFLVAEIRLFL